MSWPGFSWHFFLRSKQVDRNHLSCLKFFTAFEIRGDVSFDHLPQKGRSPGQALSQKYLRS